MSRQRFGQHFLTSSHVLGRIAQAACGDHSRTVIEIGPGQGALTEHLLPRVDRLVAIEIDPALAEHLRTRFAAEPKLQIIEGDALTHDFASHAPDLICGNLPYYLATPLLEKIARVGFPAVALIQKEVAARLAAQPGSREYGFLTCQIALFAQVKYLFGVKPGAFRPPPKVESAVIRLTSHPRATELGVDEREFLRFLSRCFRHKRKTLRNNLAAFYSDEQWSAMSDANLRAEQRSLEQLAVIYQHLERAPSARVSASGVTAE